jgi:hypothetical protein
VGHPEATTGFEPVIRVLQTLALPLGHVAVMNLFVLTTGFGDAQFASSIRVLQTLALPEHHRAGHVAKNFF